MTRRSSPRVLGAAFYARPTEEVARDLLGCVLEHRTPTGMTRGRIVEVEAYFGPEDPACHSARGWTERTRHLHGPPGRAYVYRIYGLHWCVNAVTREVGHGSAVLLRAVEPLEGREVMQQRRGAVPDRQLARGPGNLCQAFGITGSDDGVSLSRGRLRILSGDPVADAEVLRTPRVGITQAAEWPLRFSLRGSPWVSGPQPRR